MYEETKRFEDSNISEEVRNILDANSSYLGKELYRFSRAEFFSLLRNLPGRLPRKMDNIVFLLNRATLRLPDILKIEPPPVSDLWDRIEYK